MTEAEQPDPCLPLALVSSYVPRQCGLATFTRDLARAIAPGGTELPGARVPDVVAITETGAHYEYPREVVFGLRAAHRTDYRQAADFLNVSPVRTVCIQHEFGIFGGEDGSHVLALMGNLKKPIITTLHTVLAEPTEGQRRTLVEVCRFSARVVVMACRAAGMLREIYGVSAEKIEVIPHGVPDVPFADPGFYKDRFQLEGRQVVLTFGLLGRNKGIEVAIEAMAEVVREFPEAVYVVLGATHPAVRRQEGEAYRVGLEQQVARLGLADHVVFRKRYVSARELRDFLLGADYYVTPYRTRDQITSGTLAYAVGCGKAVVSTPYWYAQELLADGRGVLIDFDDSGQLAAALKRLMRDHVERDQMRKRAYLYARTMVWDAVAQAYLRAAGRAIHTFGRLQRRAALRKPIPEPAVPEVHLNHMRLLTDDTGILQHAVHATPNRTHGYCTDDVARAVVVVADNWRLLRDADVLGLLQTYLAFLHHAFNETNGRFRNFMSYEREWQEGAGSEDSHGRALWALGELLRARPSDPVLALASRLFDQALPAALKFTSPRAWACALMGLHAHHSRFSRARETYLAAGELTIRLYRLFKQNATDDWPWFEQVVAYSNARLAHGLMLGGELLERGPIIDAALRALDWLFRIQTVADESRLSLIGNEGWFTRGGRKAAFDQQPIEAACLIRAAHEAYRITGDRLWVRRMRLCMRWFLGLNDLNQPLYDFQTGGCRDGLHAGGVNQNQGAESTLAYLMTVQTMHLLDREDTLEVITEPLEPGAPSRPAPSTPDAIPAS
jgi:glycosyltransferase involved in cell wall biosynthesis